MEQVATLRFRDVEADGDALVIVRASEGEVALALSLLDDGDTELFLDPTTCQQVIEALQRALRIARQPANAG